MKVDELKKWLSNELNGYLNESEVPKYRIFSVQIVGDFVDTFGRQAKNAPLMLQDLGKSMDINFYEHVEKGSIKTIEDAVNASSHESSLILPFTQNMVHTLADLYRDTNADMHLISAGRIVLPSQYSNILDQTKQRLLDMLLELQEKFPDIDSNFTPTSETKEQTRSIVNYNIYGGTNNTNLGVGDNVVQSDNKQSIKIDFKDFQDKLRIAGVPDDEIQAVKEIIQSNEPKEGKFSRAMSWIGNLTKNMIAKGIELKLPDIIEATQKMIEQFGGV